VVTGGGGHGGASGRGAAGADEPVDGRGVVVDGRGADSDYPDARSAEMFGAAEILGGPVRIVAIEGAPLSVPLREPFVIATGRIDVTRAVLVRATLEDEDGRRAVGLGEAAALPPVTHEDQPELLDLIARAGKLLPGVRLTSLSETATKLEETVPDSAVARAGLESAVLDAWARLRGTSVACLLGAPVATPLPILTTDITLPITAPAAMTALALRHRAAGFTCFKVKVGRDWRADRESLRAVASAVPDAHFRLDANGGFTARDALALLDATAEAGLIVECYEQPCAREDLAGMSEVTARSAVPVVADESFRGEADLQAIIAHRAAHAVNLKLVKLGGLLKAVTLARVARAAGLRLMAGAMVETRVGLLAMAHVVAALGGVDWVDLDTAFLLAQDPFEGGWSVEGPRISLTTRPLAEHRSG
jgi:L-alanine-DL-glutamate epimerase-like enolase superfamily enzyme